MQYKIVISNNLEEFMEEVNKLIENGYVPQGGISTRSITETAFRITYSRPEYSQALYKS